VDSLKQAVIKTLAFFDLYNRPLTIMELYTFLWMYKCNMNNVSQHLKRISGVVEKNDFYVLDDQIDTIKQHTQRKKRELKQWELVSKYIPRLRWIPYIKMIAVCNSLAMQTSETKSDIDLFIIIKNKRLWTTRLCITIFIHLLGIRRYKNKIHNRFCLSFFITDQSLDLSPIALKNGDVYFYYWLATLIPIIDRNTYETFWDKNKNFIHGALPNVKRQEVQQVIVPRVTKFLEFLFRGFIGDMVELIIRLFLKKRAEKKKAKINHKKANIIISDTILKFHNVDTRSDIQKKWCDRIDQISIR
jgi:hypothetical protein